MVVKLARLEYRSELVVLKQENEVKVDMPAGREEMKPLTDSWSKDMSSIQQGYY